MLVSITICSEIVVRHYCAQLFVVDSIRQSSTLGQSLKVLVARSNCPKASLAWVASSALVRQSWVDVSRSWTRGSSTPVIRLTVDQIVSESSHWHYSGSETGLRGNAAVDSGEESR